MGASQVRIGTRRLSCVLVRCPQTFARYVSAAFALPPIGTAYVAASMREAGHDVRMVDCVGEAIDRFTPIDDEGLLLRRGLSDEEVLDRIGDADVIGFSLMFSQDWLPTRSLIEQVRERYPDAVLVAGGEHFSADPEGALATSPLDFVLTGEGDRSICDLLEHIHGTRAIEDVPGCWFRRDGSIAHTDRAPRIRDIDDLPRPAWDLVPLSEYLDGGHMVSVDRGRSLPINATRGCPFQCTFCSSPSMWTTRYVTRSPSLVVEEMADYAARYSVSNFEFVDLTAIVRKSWAMDFTERLIEADLGITWQLPSGTRSEALDDEVLQRLVRSGCTNLTYAPESGDEETLDRIKKRVKLDRMLVSMRSAVKAGANVKANLIFGLPGETRGSILRSFRFLAKMAAAGVHDISIAPLKPYPGSELFRELQGRGLIPDPLDDDYYRGLAVGAENLPFSMEPAPSYADGLSAHELDRLRIAALAWFFGLSWLMHPIRPFQLVWALVTGRQRSRLDKSLAELKHRVLRPAARGPAPVPRRVNPF
jgi:anaerobic magnesium-protoporphyrin IX monomethyl ester cyclase